MVTIGRVESRPQLDPYRADTGGATYTALKIDPQARRAWVNQEYHDNAPPSDEWHGIVLAYPLRTKDHHSHWPDQEMLSELLNSTEGQALLTRICEGHRVEWDGHNMVGRLSDDAQEAQAQLLKAIRDLPCSGWSIASARDWLYEIRDELREQLAAGRDADDLAEEWDADAREDHMTLYGTRDYIRSLVQ